LGSDAACSQITQGAKKLVSQIVSIATLVVIDGWFRYHRESESKILRRHPSQSKHAGDRFGKYSCEFQRSCLKHCANIQKYFPVSFSQILEDDPHKKTMRAAKYHPSPDVRNGMPLTPAASANGGRRTSGT
jgi:hypothetical protein